METKNVLQEYLLYDITLLQEYQLYTRNFENKYLEMKIREQMGGDRGVHLGFIK